MRSIGQLGNKYPTIRILARETARKLGPREQEGTCQPEQPLHVWSRTLKATIYETKPQEQLIEEKGTKGLERLTFQSMSQKTKYNWPATQIRGHRNVGEKKKFLACEESWRTGERKFKQPHQYVWEYRWDNVTRWPQVSSSDTNDAAQQGGCRMFRKECGLKNYIQ